MEEIEWVRQGGAMPAAREGVFQLAAEIAAFVEASALAGPWKVHIDTECVSYFCVDLLTASPISFLLAR